MLTNRAARRHPFSPNRELHQAWVVPPCFIDGVIIEMFDNDEIDPSLMMDWDKFDEKCNNRWLLFAWSLSLPGVEVSRLEEENWYNC